MINELDVIILSAISVQSFFKKLPVTNLDMWNEIQNQFHWVDPAVELKRQILQYLKELNTIDETINTKLSNSQYFYTETFKLTGWFAGLSLRGAAYVRTDRVNQRVKLTETSFHHLSILKEGFEIRDF